MERAGVAGNVKTVKKKIREEVRREWDKREGSKGKEKEKGMRRKRWKGVNTV